MSLRSAALLLSIAFAFVPAAHGAETVTVHPDPAEPGDIVIVEASAIPQRATFALSVLRFMRIGGKFRAITGIDVDSPPGDRQVSLRWSYTTPYERALPIRAKKFPELRGASPPKPETKEEKDRFWSESQAEETIFRHVTAAGMWVGRFQLPLEGQVEVPFGARRTAADGTEEVQSGALLRTSPGVPVHPSNYGRVALVQDLFSTGKTVIVDHGMGLYTVYGRLGDLAVHRNEHVAADTVLGHVADSGPSAGLLYWEARLMQARVDPFQLLRLDLTRENIHGRND